MTGIRLLATFVLVGGVAAAAPAPSTTTLVIVGTSDMHGHVEAQREEVHLDGGKAATVERGGVVLLGGYLDALRARHPGHVLVVDGGDMLQGTLASNLGEGHVMMVAMNAMGYAAAAVGNHEFDFGPVGPDVIPRKPGEDPRGVIRARAAEAHFPWLTANVVDGKGQPPGAPRVARWTLVETGGVKVGIVGGTSEDTPRTTMKPNLVGLQVLPLAPAVAVAAAEVRKAGATVVIAVVHAGSECKRLDDPNDLASCDATGESFKLARALAHEPAERRVDAIFGGHTHQMTAALVDGIPVAQAGSETRAFARVDLTVSTRDGRVVAGGARVYPPTDLCGAVSDGNHRCKGHLVGRSLVPATVDGEVVKPDAAVAAAIAPDLERANARRAEPVGITLAGKVWRSYKTESPLGNLVADMTRSLAGSDIGLANGGGLRAELPAGELRYGSLFEALPFDNRLAVVRLHGRSIEHLVAANLPGEHGLLSFSGLRVASRCDGDRLDVRITLEDGHPLDPEHVYTVGTSDFLALGGDDFPSVAEDMKREGVVIRDDLPPLREQFVDWLKHHGGTLRPDDPALFDPARPRVTLPMARPFRCDAAAAAAAPTR